MTPKEKGMGKPFGSTNYWREVKEQMENLNRSCAKEAIDLVKNANSACDVRLAENIVEQVYWNSLPGEMYDQWQEFHGDAKNRYCY